MNMGFLGSSMVKNLLVNAGDSRRRGFNSRVEKIPLEGEMTTHSSILA